MIKRLFNGLLVLAALLISTPAWADEVSVLTLKSTPTVSVPVIQPLPALDSRVIRGVVCPARPNATDLWPTNTVSLVGGCHTTSEQQRWYAMSKGLPFATDEARYQALIADGTFVHLSSGQHLRVLAGRPYVRAETAQFVYTMAEAYSGVGCGRMVVVGAGRLITEIYENSSTFTVHPFGMAVDIRTRAELGVTPDCAEWIRAYTQTKEAQLIVDGTQEISPEHLHIVVVPIIPSTPGQLTHQETLTEAP